MLVEAIEGRMKAGSDLVIVSSGARRRRGIEPLGLPKRPNGSGHQAGGRQRRAGGPGQRVEFGVRRLPSRTVGQVLLTAQDIAMRVQHSNAQRTLDRLRALHAVAIVNENDTVATSTRSGSVTTTGSSALVAQLVGADALILLSDYRRSLPIPILEAATRASFLRSPHQDDLDGVGGRQG